MLSAYAHPTKRLPLIAIFSPRPLFSTPDFRIAHLTRLEVKLDNSKTESALIAAEGMDVSLADVRSTSFGHDLKVKSHTERRRWLQAANRAAGARDVGFADKEGWWKEVVGGCGGSSFRVDVGRSVSGYAKSSQLREPAGELQVRQSPLIELSFPPLRVLPTTTAVCCPYTSAMPERTNGTSLVPSRDNLS